MSSSNAPHIVAEWSGALVTIGNRIAYQLLRVRSLDARVSEKLCGNPLILIDQALRVNVGETAFGS